MSGDGRLEGYNEPEAMRQFALSLGVPDEAIFLDLAGRRTYDTCYRAKEVFGVKNALLVTQGFHLPRALFLCNSLGLDASGVEANNHRFWRGSLLIWNVREQFATLGAFLDVYVSNPHPVLGEPGPLGWIRLPTFRLPTFGDWQHAADCCPDTGFVDKSRLSVDKCLSLWRSPIPVWNPLNSAPPYMGAWLLLPQDVD
jgi:hypothetical protein